MQEWQTVTQVATELCGFITIVTGTFMLHAARDSEGQRPAAMSSAKSNSSLAEIQMQHVGERMPLTSPAAVGSGVRERF